MHVASWLGTCESLTVKGSMPGHSSCCDKEGRRETRVLLYGPECCERKKLDSVRKVLCSLSLYPRSPTRRAVKASHPAVRPTTHFAAWQGRCRWQRSPFPVWVSVRHSVRTSPEASPIQVPLVTQKRLLYLLPSPPSTYSPVCKRPRSTGHTNRMASMATTMRGMGTALDGASKVRKRLETRRV